MTGMTLPGVAPGGTGTVTDCPSGVWVCRVLARFSGFLVNYIVHI